MNNNALAQEKVLQGETKALTIIEDDLNSILNMSSSIFSRVDDFLLRVGGSDLSVSNATLAEEVCTPIQATALHQIDDVLDSIKSKLSRLDVAADRLDKIA